MPSHLHSYYERLKKIYEGNKQKKQRKKKPSENKFRKEVRQLLETVRKRQSTDKKK
jgi:flavin-dependent dehydrogenase